MDFFTQTVDSSLWTSRTFEDPEYDGDTAAADVSRVAWTAEITGTHLLNGGLNGLVIATGADAARAVEASVKLDGTLGSFSSGDTKVAVSSSKNGVAIAVVDVDDALAVSLAQIMLSTLQPKRTLVLSSCAQWSLRGRPEPGKVVWMTTPSATAKYSADKPKLSAPSFLTGNVAAFVAEGELSQREVSTAVLVKEGISACYGDLKLLRDTALEFVSSVGGSKVGVDILPEAEFEAGVRKQLKTQRASDHSMYM